MTVLIGQISDFGFHTFQLLCSISVLDSVLQEDVFEEDPENVGAYGTGAKKDTTDDVFQFGLIIREIFNQDEPHIGTICSFVRSRTWYFRWIFLI